MVAYTAKLLGPAVLGGPARSTIKKLLRAKNVNDLLVSCSFALLLGLGLFHFSYNIVSTGKKVYLFESYTTRSTLNAILAASLA